MSSRRDHDRVRRPSSVGCLWVMGSWHALYHAPLTDAMKEWSNAKQRTRRIRKARKDAALLAYCDLIREVHTQRSLHACLEDPVCLTQLGDKFVDVDCAENAIMLKNASGQVSISCPSSQEHRYLGLVEAPDPRWSDDYQFVDVSLTDSVTRLSCGSEHVVVVTHGNRCITWGNNGDPSPLYRLGHVTPGSCGPIPVSIPMDPPSRIVQVSCGQEHTLLLCDNGTLFSFGSNDVGQCGRPSLQASSLLPGRVDCSATMECEPRIVFIAAGAQHSLAVTDVGHVLGWGANECGQVGSGTTCGSVSEPYLLPLLTSHGLRAITVCAGDRHSMLLAHDGTIMTWGSNASGQCGVGKAPKQVLTPTRIALDAIASQATASSSSPSSTPLSSSPTTPSPVASSSPVSPKTSTPTNANPACNRPINDSMRPRYLSCGSDRSAVCTMDGSVYVWGTALSSSCWVAPQCVPRRIHSLWYAHHVVTKVACGRFHLALLEDKATTHALRTLVRTMTDTDPSHVSQLQRIWSQQSPIIAAALHARAHAWRVAFASSPLSRVRLHLAATRLVFRLRGIAVKSSTQVISLQLQSPKSVHVRAHVCTPLGDVDTRYGLTLSPEHVKLSRKRPKGSIVARLRCHKAAVEEVTILVALDCVLASAAASTSPSPASASSSPPSSSTSLASPSPMSSSNPHASTPSASYGSSEERRASPTTGGPVLRYWILCVIRPDGAQTTSLTKNAERSAQLVAALASYVPRQIVHFFQHYHSGALQQPLWATFYGTVLFIDVAGFTRLNARLAKLGAEGPERVSRHLNSYFGHIIDAVHSWGGDVVKFAGDALICLFTQWDPATQWVSMSEKPIPRPCAAVVRRTVAWQAVRCGYHIQSTPKLATYDSGEGFTLSLHVGVGTGLLTALHVGGTQGSWEFLVTGEAFPQLETAVESSHAGQVVVSPQTWTLVRDQCSGEACDASPDYGNMRICSINAPLVPTLQALRRPTRTGGTSPVTLHLDAQAGDVGGSSARDWPGGDRAGVRPPSRRGAVLLSVANQAEVAGASSSFAWTPLAPEDTQSPAGIAFERALRSYVQPGVQARLDSLQGGWLAELRTVTILFVKLWGSGLTFQPEGEPLNLKRLQAAACAMQRVVFRFQGLVRQFLVDDKGTVLVAGFGVPFAHEDDALRGVKAALQICSQLSTMGIDNAIGVTTGPVFTGSVGSEERQEYAMVGDAVNMSARLMGVAAAQQRRSGNRILVDHGTWCATRTHHRIHYDVKDPVVVKGKTEAVPVYAPAYRAQRGSTMLSLLRSVSLSSVLGVRVDEVEGAGAHNADASGDGASLMLKRTEARPAGVASTTASPLAAVKAMKGDSRTRLMRSQRLVSSPVVTASVASTMLIGRKKECSVLRAALFSLMCDDSRLVIIEGEAGVGKSALVGYALKAAHGLVPKGADMPMSVFVAQGESTERTTPYGMLRSMLTSMLISLTRQPGSSGALAKVSPASAVDEDGFSVSDLPSMDQVAMALNLVPGSDSTSLPASPPSASPVQSPYVGSRRGVTMLRQGEWPTDLLPVLNDCLPGLSWDETPQSAGLSARLRDVKARELAKLVVASVAAEKPLFVVLEDLHHADVASLRLIIELCEEVKPLLLLCTTRPFFSVATDGQGRQQQRLQRQHQQQQPQPPHAVQQAQVGQVTRRSGRSLTDNALQAFAAGSDDFISTADLWRSLVTQAQGAPDSASFLHLDAMSEQHSAVMIARLVHMMSVCQLRQAQRCSEATAATAALDSASWRVPPLLPVLSVSQSLLHYVMSKARGNPKFASEVVQSLVDAGTVKLCGAGVEDGNDGTNDGADTQAHAEPVGQTQGQPRWELRGDLSVVRLPHALHTIITSRLDKLEGRHQMVLKVASVLGVEFHTDVLQAMYPIEEERVHVPVHLALLSKEACVREHGNGLYVFNDESIQEVAYKRLLSQQRQALHEAALTYYLGESDAALVSAHVAFHAVTLAHMLFNNLFLQPGPATDGDHVSGGTRDASDDAQAGADDSAEGSHSTAKWAKLEDLLAKAARVSSPSWAKLETMIVTGVRFLGLERQKPKSYYESQLYRTVPRQRRMRAASPSASVSFSAQDFLQVHDAERVTNRQAHTVYGIRWIRTRCEPASLAKVVAACPPFSRKERILAELSNASSDGTSGTDRAVRSQRGTADRRSRSVAAVGLAQMVAAPEGAVRRQSPLSRSVTLALDASLGECDGRRSPSLRGSSRHPSSGVISPRRLQSADGVPMFVRQATQPNKSGDLATLCGPGIMSSTTGIVPNCVNTEFVGGAVLASLPESEDSSETKDSMEAAPSSVTTTTWKDDVAEAQSGAEGEGEATLRHECLVKLQRVASVARELHQAHVQSVLIPQLLALQTSLREVVAAEDEARDVAGVMSMVRQAEHLQQCVASARKKADTLAHEHDEVKIVLATKQLSLPKGGPELRAAAAVLQRLAAGLTRAENACNLIERAAGVLCRKVGVSAGGKDVPASVQSEASPAPGGGTLMQPRREKAATEAKSDAAPARGSPSNEVPASGSPVLKQGRTPSRSYRVPRRRPVASRRKSSRDEPPDPRRRSVSVAVMPSQWRSVLRPRRGDPTARSRAPTMVSEDTSSASNKE